MSDLAPHLDDATIAVCGATGKQGGAVARVLADRGVRVVALTRTPESDPARALAAAGMTVRRADLLDPASLEAAFEGVWGVFGMTTPFNADYTKCDTEAEQRQGFNLVDACAASGVSHLVLTTVLDFDDGPSIVPYINSKREVERHLERSGVRYTLLQPGAFMEEIGGMDFTIRKGKVRGSCARDARVPSVATEDIAAAAKMAFEDPERFAGETLPLIADYCSGHDLVETLERMREGERFKYSTYPLLLVRIFAPLVYPLRVTMERWSRSERAEDLQRACERFRALRPDALTVERYLQREGWATRSW